MCNLACTWGDTTYTWDWQSYDVKREVVAGGGDAVVDVALRILLALRRTNGFAVEDVEAE